MNKTLTILAILFFTVIFGIYANARETPNVPDKQAEKQYDQNIQIKKKSPPRVPRDCDQASGRARLRVTFDKSEKVTDVEIIESSGCSGFDQNALRAAKLIKFKAATKNGEPVTVKNQVEYSYMIGARSF